VTQLVGSLTQVPHGEVQTSVAQAAGPDQVPVATPCPVEHEVHVVVVVEQAVGPPQDPSQFPVHVPGAERETAGIEVYKLAHSVHDATVPAQVAHGVLQVADPWAAQTPGPDG